ncbi:MAG: hypothetical protein EAX89_12300 [Candidatus Lokiarchaeota archaeon]|nr:hypothetical protein [Candidatus Lokiarchaeota archaeon]
MSNIQNYQFFPAIECWIKQILEGKYNDQDKSLFTIFGNLKRTRLVATIIEKEELISKKLSNDEDISKDTNLNYRFILDDGSGVISAIKWNVDSEFYKNLKRGDMVNIIGKIRSWNNKVQISLENVNLLDSPNYILLNDAKIIKKMKNENLYEIPTDDGDYSKRDNSLNTEEEFLFNDISDDIDIDTLFENDRSPEVNTIKEHIYSIIEEYSQNGNGITLSELKLKLNIPEEKIRTYIKDLEMESRIYQSEENLYQSF